MNIESFVYVGSPPPGSWSNFDWGSVASSASVLQTLLDRLDPRKRTCFVVLERSGWDWLLGVMECAEPPRRWGSTVVALGDFAPDWASGALMKSRFERCIQDPPILLPDDELLGVWSEPNRAEYCIGGTILHEQRVAVLLRGDMEVLPVPLSAFRPSADGVTPDFNDFGVTDFGQTLRFGRYEASFEAVLYEVDPAFRRTLNARRRKEDRTLGGALRRLRAQKGVGRDEFPGITEKTISRIERGEVKRPQTATLKVIADRLGVPIEEMDSY